MKNNYSIMELKKKKKGYNTEKSNKKQVQPKTKIWNDEFLSRWSFTFSFIIILAGFTSLSY